MLDNAISVFRTLQSYADSILSDITAEECCRQPWPGANHAAWTVGHMAIALDRHAAFVGAESKLGEWKALFGKGSEPKTDASEYPPWEDLVQGFRDACGRMTDAAAAATPEQLAVENTYVSPETMPTIGDFVTFSMTAHTAMHLGQLAAWRRALGRPVLF